MELLSGQLRARPGGRRLFDLASLFFFACLLTPTVADASIAVLVLDRNGKPIPDVAVYANSAGTEFTSAGTASVAVMDQVDKRFVPHLLVVQVGTLVEFPNSDPTAHHVYSFSRPNQFNLPLYKGEIQPSVRFTQEGIVTLGCNIHDNMLSYIFVVDTPLYAKTDADGRAVLETGLTDELEVRIWSPRIRDTIDSLVEIVASEVDQQLTYQVVKKLRVRHNEESAAISWPDY